MSAFIGFIGSQDPTLHTSVGAMVPEPDFSWQNGRFCVFGKGAADRFFSSVDEDTKSGWVVSGIGLETDSPFNLLNSKRWDKHLHQPKERIHRLNGYFAAIRFSADHIEFFTDALGMRSLFLAQVDETLLFSTRFDWLLQLLPEKTIDWRALGSSWLTLNAFNGKSIVDEIMRVHSSGYVSVKKGSFAITSQKWTPKSQNSAPSTFTETLTSLSISPFDAGNPVSLGLSGGLDSRVLFATLLGQSQAEFGLYTFSGLDHPDEKVARLLNEPFEKNHLFLPQPVVDHNQILKDLPELAARTMLASSIPQLSIGASYKMLGLNQPRTIDGGFGEIGRRRFLRSVELNARQAIFDKSARRMMPYFLDMKANIFKTEPMHEMQSGLVEDLQVAVDAMPDARTFGLENWLDLFLIRTRVPNLAGIRQDIMDEHVFHLMPFLQPALLHQIFSLPLTERKNGALYRSIIQKSAPHLTKVPLVKGNDSYPYRLKDVAAMAWMKAKRKVGMGFSSPGQTASLLALEEYVRDTFSPTFLNASTCYSEQKVLRLIEEFYTKKDERKASSINWLISFESIRKQL